MAELIRFRIMLLPLRRGEIHGRVVGEHRRALRHDVVQDRRRHRDGRVGAVATPARARRSSPSRREEDDAAVGADELEDAREDLLEQLSCRARAQSRATARARGAAARSRREAARCRSRSARTAGSPLRGGDLRADRAVLVVHVDARAMNVLRPLRRRARCARTGLSPRRPRSRGARRARRAGELRVDRLRERRGARACRWLLRLLVAAADRAPPSAAWLCAGLAPAAVRWAARRGQDLPPIRVGDGPLARACPLQGICDAGDGPLATAGRPRGVAGPPACRGRPMGAPAPRLRPDRRRIGPRAPSAISSPCLSAPRRGRARC